MQEYISLTPEQVEYLKCLITLENSQLLEMSPNIGKEKQEQLYRIGWIERGEDENPQITELGNTALQSISCFPGFLSILESRQMTLATSLLDPVVRESLLSLIEHNENSR